MKRYLSVFEMITRSSIYKVLGVCLLMLGAEVAAFLVTMNRPVGLSFEEFIEYSPLCLIFKIAYVLLTVVLVLPGMNLGSVQGYTLRRLRVKEVWVFWLQLLYNCFAYVILWATQLLAIWISMMVYRNQMPEGAAPWTNQTAFLAFYRSDFLHSILPLEDVSGWWITGLLLGMTALCGAVFTRYQRRGQFAFELLICVVVTVLALPRQLGYEMSFPLAAVGFLLCIVGSRAFISKEVESE